MAKPAPVHYLVCSAGVIDYLQSVTPNMDDYVATRLSYWRKYPERLDISMRSSFSEALFNDYGAEVVRNHGVSFLRFFSDEQRTMFALKWGY